AARRARLAGVAAESGKVSPLWLVAMNLVGTAGELSLSPVGLSASTKLAPQAAVGTTMGIWFLSTSVGDVCGGPFAELDAAVSPGVYLGLLGRVAAAAGIALLLVVRPVVKLMAGIR